MKAANPLNAYRETQIKTAGQITLIIMLYDGAIRNIKLAIENVHGGHCEYDAINNHIIKAQDIISELMISLDFEKGGDIARNLFDLYMYINRKLLEANMKKTTGPLEEVRDLLSQLRDAWSRISQKSERNSGAGGENGINIAG